MSSWSLASLCQGQRITRECTTEITRMFKELKGKDYNGKQRLNLWSDLYSAKASEENQGAFGLGVRGQDRMTESSHCGSSNDV